MSKIRYVSIVVVVILIPVLASSDWGNPSLWFFVGAIAVALIVANWVSSRRRQPAAELPCLLCATPTAYRVHGQPICPRCTSQADRGDQA